MSFYDAIRVGASGAADYEVERSLRFNTTDQTEVTNSSLGTSPTSRRISTVSVWTKRSDLSSGLITYGYSGGGASQNNAGLRFVNSNTNLGIENAVNNSTIWQLVTTRDLRDFNTWYHIVVAIDTTQSTASDRVKVYINGVQETSFSTANYPSQNYDNLWLYSNARIGASDGNGSYYAGWNGYIAEYHAIDGQALTPASFGETDATTGQWNPIKYTGSYGTNGHYLNFSDNSGTTATTLGKDYSGNGKNFTPSNLSVSAGTGNDSVEDTPTNNFPTFNPLNAVKYSNNYSPIVQQGNLLMRGGDNYVATTFLLPKSGKWYVEFSKYGNGAPQAISVTRANKNISGYDGALGLADMVQYVSNGELGDRSRGSTSDATVWQDDADIVVAIAVDMDNGAVYFARANTWQNSGNPTSGASKTGAMGTDIKTDNNGDHVIAAEGYNGNDNYGMYVNFGQRAFTYTPPTGYEKLCSANLPDPTIKLPNKHFDTLLWEGNGTSGHAITGLDFQPDFVWIKNRDGTYYHNLSDTVRGITKAMNSNSTDTENTYSNIQSVQSNGFTVGGSELVNKNNQDLVAWNWNAGGSTVTNTDGSLSAQVRANPTAGFSILTYTGTNNVSETLGHGLGVKPDMIIVKSRDVAGQDWVVYNKNLDGGNQPATHILKLNGYAGEQDVNDVWQDTEPTSSVFTVGTEAMVNYTTGNLYVAYCFAGVEGYSKFGKYVGNGNSNGTYVYTGFKPAFVITRGLHGTSWYIYDNKRNPVNVVNKELNSNNTQSEATFTTMDFNSNGFKIRSSNDAFNYNNYNYIYLAFAESPYKYSRAR